MCAAILQSDAIPHARWSDGAAEIGFTATGGETRLGRLYQSDPCRVLFPRPARGGPFEAVVVTTSGGLVGGDRLRIAVTAEADSMACATTQAAEKVYRSTGATAEIEIDIAARSGAVLEWIPQDTILFDGARLRRETRVEAAPGTRILAGEPVVFGRLARGETFSAGLFHDSWRVTRDGVLVWADGLHLDGSIETLLSGPATFDGAVAMATLVYIADDAAACVDGARALLADGDEGGCTAAATHIDAVLVVRLLGHDAAALRARYRRFWSGFRASVLGMPRALPRVWDS